MVAVMHAIKSAKAALRYNETKVKKGEAQLISAGYYLKNAEQLSKAQKLARLYQRAALNLRTVHPFTHLSLNFHPSEQIPLETLKQIAEHYLKRIGYDQQPYLVYQHWDAAHPHLHVLSTCIKSSGERIDVGPSLIKRASEQTEQQFNLRPAQSSSRRVLSGQALRAEYAKRPTLEALDEVVSQVLPRYSFTSESEMNALLSLYGVRLSIHRSKGRKKSLRYQMISAEGRPQGVPIKAFDLTLNPNRMYLRKQYSFHALQRKHQSLQPLLSRLSGCMHPARSLADFVAALACQALQVVWESRSQSLVYIDHQGKGVFSAASLGLSWQAPGLQARFEISLVQLKEQLNPSQQSLRRLGPRRQSVSFHL